MSLPRVLLLAALSLSFVTPSVRGDNWPQWRGLHHDNISHEKNVPTKWSATENIAWKLELPGAAGATPAVWGDRIFLTSAAGSDLLLMCIGTDGKEQWRKTVATGNRDVRSDEGNSAAPSPCTDGKYVWTFMATGALACYTVDGKDVWTTDLQQRYGKFSIAFGMTSTPILDDGKLYLQLIHGEGNPATREAVVICLDGATGKEIWKADRPSDGRDECEHSYASPTIYRDDKLAYLITHGADYTVGHSLKDGSELWRVGGLNPKGNYNPTLRFVASPAAVPGFIVVPSAKGGPVLCLKPELKGDVTDDKNSYHWQRPRDTPDVPTPLIVDGLVYLCRENGNLICMDAKTGEEYYNKRTTADRHRASPMYADGHIYLTARKGKITVVKAGKELEIVKVNDVGEEISATPVIANGRVYIRTFASLIAVGP